MWHSIQNISFFIAAVALTLSAAIAQPPTPSDDQLLTEELLKDIVPKDSSSDQKSKDRLDDSQRSFGASDNPLEVIHMGMLTASKYLKEGETGKTTQDVQSNVLSRLDELIALSEKQSRKPRNSKPEASNSRSKPQSSETEKQDRSQTSRNAPQPKSSSQRNEQQTGEQPKSDRQNPDQSDSDSETSPNNSGEDSRDGSLNSKAAPGDPRSLQEGVWGHLPEKIRQQMMTRMVERFLPEYEASIEEYFRKLSESESESEQP